MGNFATDKLGAGTIFWTATERPIVAPNGTLYWDVTDENFYVRKFDAWVELLTGSSGTGITGTIANNQIAFGTAPNTIGGSPNFTFTAGAVNSLQLIGGTGSGSFLGSPTITELRVPSTTDWNLVLTNASAPAGAVVAFGLDNSGNFSLNASADGVIANVGSIDFNANGDVMLTSGQGSNEILTLLHAGGATFSSAPFTIGNNFHYTDVAGTQDLILGTGVNGNLDIRVTSAATHFIGPTAVGADTMDFLVHGVPMISETTTNGTTDQAVTILQKQAGAGNFVFTSDLLTINGATSGSAGVGVAAAAGTPNTILLPTTTGAAGTFLQTNGANPQQTSWVAAGSVVASGTATMPTGALTANTSSAAVTVAGAGILATDAIEWAFNAAPGTGYTEGVFIAAYVTSGNVNFIQTNPTAGSRTPAAATLNWRVIR